MSFLPEHDGPLQLDDDGLQVPGLDTPHQVERLSNENMSTHSTTNGLIHFFTI